jgi:hypothetical protein
MDCGDELPSDSSFQYGETEVPDATDRAIAALAPDESPLLVDSDFDYACQHPGCGVELFYGGRGRKPTHCKTHQPLYRKTRGSVGTNTRTSKADWQTPLADALATNFVGIGMVVYAFEQFDGQTIITGSPRLAQSLVGVAQTNPSVRRSLEKFVESAGWAQVAAAAASIALPIMQHHKLLPSFSLPMPATAGVA